MNGTIIRPSLWKQKSGIVALSDPQMEFQETLLKGKALINAMILTIQGEFDPNQFDIQGIETAPSDNYKKVGVQCDRLGC